MVLRKAGLVVLGACTLLSSGRGACASEYKDDVSREDYLHALEQIMPAARDAADAYAIAFQQNCGRPITTVELRKAVADGDGDPVLMAMVRAVHYKDDLAMKGLRGSVSCGVSQQRR
jgi:hypothetical protein